MPPKRACIETVGAPSAQASRSKSRSPSPAAIEARGDSASLLESVEIIPGKISKISLEDIDEDHFVDVRPLDARMETLAPI
ncbi:hypothetical protein HDU93_003035, partial [Gonapodya sp. JEL0774]